jgi:hypothetical protein
VALGQGPEERIGQRVLPQVGEQFLVDLEGREVGRGLDGLFGESLDDGGLVAGGVDELVVQDLDVGVFAWELHDLVGDGLGIGEGGNILADASKAQLDVPAVGTTELRPGLLADEDEVGSRLLRPHEVASDVARQARVNAAAKALVGAADDVENLLALALQSLRLGRLEHLVGRVAVLVRIVHCSLGAGELGRGHNLHRVGDLLDVADRLQAALDLAQSSVASSIVDGAASMRQSVIVLPVVLHTCRRRRVHVRTSSKQRRFPTYRAGIAAAPALRADRAARESIVKGVEEGLLQVSCLITLQFEIN